MAVQFFDDFNDNSIDPAKWITPVDSGISEVGGALEMTSTQVGNKAFESLNSYNLTDRFCAVEFKQVPASTQSGSYSLILSPSSSFPIYWHFTVYQGILEAYQTSTKFFNAPYNPSIHKWVRFRFTAIKVFAEYSTNGIDWLTLAETPLSGDITALRVYLRQYVNGGGITQTGTWDNVSVEDSPVIVYTYTETSSHKSSIIPRNVKLARPVGSEGGSQTPAPSVGWIFPRGNKKV